MPSPVQIALSRSLADAHGELIAGAAPGRVELVQIDEAPDLSKAEIAVAGWLPDGVSFAQVVSRMPGLRWVHAMNAGVNYLSFLPEDVLVTNAAGAFAPSMTEYALWGTITLLRRWTEIHDAQRERDWDWERFTGGAELHGKRLGVVGYGQIGRHFALACKALGMEAWATRRTPMISLAGEPLDRLLPPSALDELLAGCDVVILTASLNPSTRDLIGEPELAAMKPGAVLVNVARGDLVDEAALEAALRSGRLGGAVLDVAREEPLPADSPLWTLPNTIVTPHVSGSTSAAGRRALDALVLNLPLYVDGRLDHMVNRVERSDLN